MGSTSSNIGKKRIWHATNAYLKKPLIQSKNWFETLGDTYIVKLAGSRFLVTQDIELLEKLAYETSHGGLNHLYYDLGFTQINYDHFNNLLENKETGDWLKVFRNYTAVEVAQCLEKGSHHSEILSHVTQKMCLWPLSQLLVHIDLRRLVHPSSVILNDTIQMIYKMSRSSLPSPHKHKWYHIRSIKNKITALHKTQTQYNFNDYTTLVGMTAHWSQDLSHTLQWFWIQLSKNTELLFQLQQEVTAQLTDNPYKNEDLSRLPLLHATLLEILRLYPWRWNFSYPILPGTEIQGYIPHPKTSLLTFPYWIHRDTSLWPAPLMFEPKRFLAYTQNNTPLPWYFQPLGSIQNFSTLYQMSIHILMACSSSILRRGSYYVVHTESETIYPYRTLESNDPMKTTFQLNQSFIHVPSERI